MDHLHDKRNQLLSLYSYKELVYILECNNPALVKLLCITLYRILCVLCTVVFVR
jgi:hypothetical protein